MFFKTENSKLRDALDFERGRTVAMEGMLKTARNRFKRAANENVELNRYLHDQHHEIVEVTARASAAEAMVVRIADKSAEAILNLLNENEQLKAELAELKKPEPEDPDGGDCRSCGTYHNGSGWDLIRSVYGPGRVEKDRIPGTAK